MDVKKVNKWIAPTVDGAPLLCMPNIPKPLHTQAPRLIEGQAKWNIMRTKCYMDADYTCQACGKYLGANRCQAHELYSIDWEHQRSKFERCVCLCAECVDEDTEVLTQDGWTKIPEITINHKVACWDKDSSIKFDYPLKTIQSHHKEAIRIKHKAGELLFSPNHRLLLKVAAKQSSNYGEYKDILAKDYKGSHYYNWIRTGVNLREEHLTNEERIFIALESDGTISYDKENPQGRERQRAYNSRYGSQDYRYTFNISLYKDRKIERLDYLLQNSNLKYEEKKNSKSGYKTWTIWTNTDCKHFKNFLSIDMGKEKAQEFLEEIVFWDGTYAEGKTSFYTNKPEEADFVQAIATQTGIKATISVVNRLGNLRKGQWATPYERLTYNVVLSSTQTETSAIRLKPEIIKWDKPMYCLSVPTTYFVARRNGFVFITGNCHTLFIHSGRAFTLYKKGELPADRMLRAVKKCFDLIYQYNQDHNDKLKVYGTFIDWARDPELGKWLEPMINKYEIEFYAPAKAYEDKKHWSNWRLLYNGKEYEPKYKDAKEWEEAMNGA